ncbi:tetratricopeptide repeat protein [uncultured Shimia sp.]|uniref:tetratricopeptide repeat protein n=1 Tax=uncultured Shimia sp. TaxID=573152 RepID=UPI0025D106A6|nr:tetratricopeptide repeat protein [uncultured Shimia sp.]
MLKDHYDNPISTSSAEAQSSYDRAVHLFLGANFGAVDAFADATTADPNFAIAHAGKARALMMTGDMPAAKAALAQAQACATQSSPREKAHINLFALMLSGKAAEARSAVWEHVRDHPRDALAAQLCSNVFGLIGFSGKVGREAELLAYTTALLPHYGDDWWMTSMHALSLCETGQIDSSLTLMEQSLAANPRNANASHFKAHAQYEAGATAEGRAYLSNWLESYDDRGVLHGHLNWHVALWALQQGDETAMWEAVDTRVGPDGAKSLPINVLTDTAAILYRAQLAGFDVAATRWKSLSDYAAQCFPETGQSFADLHAALSHAMAGEGDRLAYIADTAKGYSGDLIKPMAAAWGQIARSDWAEALTNLTPVMAQTERLGGSRAQRDLLELTYANVLMKLGKTDEAQRSLSTRRPVLANAPPLAITP